MDLFGKTGKQSPANKLVGRDGELPSGSAVSTAVTLDQQASASTSKAVEFPAYNFSSFGVAMDNSAPAHHSSWELVPSRKKNSQNRKRNAQQQNRQQRRNTARMTKFNKGKSGEAGREEGEPAPVDRPQVTPDLPQTTTGGGRKLFSRDRREPQSRSSNHPAWWEATGWNSTSSQRKTSLHWQRWGEPQRKETGTVRPSKSACQQQGQWGSRRRTGAEETHHSTPH